MLPRLANRLGYLYCVFSMYAELVSQLISSEGVLE